MATSVNGDLLALSGPRNPYPGKLGVVEKDALADLIVVNGDPVADIYAFLPSTRSHLTSGIPMPHRRATRSKCLRVQRPDAMSTAADPAQ
jgi:hypothetical protein